MDPCRHLFATYTTNGWRKREKLPIRVLIDYLIFLSLGNPYLRHFYTLCLALFWADWPWTAKGKKLGNGADLSSVLYMVNIEEKKVELDQACEFLLDDVADQVISTSVMQSITEKHTDFPCTWYRERNEFQSSGTRGEETFEMKSKFTLWDLIFNSAVWIEKCRVHESDVARHKSPKELLIDQTGIESNMKWWRLPQWVMFCTVAGKRPEARGMSFWRAENSRGRWSTTLKWVWLLVSNKKTHFPE